MHGKVSGTLLAAAAGASLMGAACWLPGASSAPRTAAANRAVESDRVVARSISTQPSSRTNRVKAPQSFDRYRRLIESNPFSPRLPNAVNPTTTITSSALVLPPAGSGTSTEKAAAPPSSAPGPATPAAPPDPLKDWAYVGTVAIGPDVYAVVENKASKQGYYLKVGDSFEGATVEQIGQAEVLVTLAGASRFLSKSSAFNATPLNAAAAPGGAPGGVPGGAGPGGKPGGPAPGAPPQPGTRPAPAGPKAAPQAAPAGARLTVPAGGAIRLAAPAR